MSDDIYVCMCVCVCDCFLVGIRSNKGSEAQYINAQLAAIRAEVRQSDMRSKVTGVQKLTYLYMLGYDISWAAFHVVEVMSSPRLHVKKIGYLAATQSFDENTEVLLLLGNLLKKDMSSTSQLEVALALDCLANVVTEELANVLIADVYELLNAGSAYVRKKATLVLYKMFLRYPDALRPSFGRLQEKLEDADQGVVVAAVTVMTELAMRNPKNYLPLAPLFFKLLRENAKGNWLMIKLVKLFGLLAPHEPRLLKKLSAPMLSLMERTTAKSLMFECLNTITSGLRGNAELVAAAMKRLPDFVQSNDLNLKYLGLKVLMNLGTSYPEHVLPYKQNVLESLTDTDPTIQECALRLVVCMITPATLPELVTALLKLIVVMNVEGDGGMHRRKFRDGLVYAVLDVCSRDRYAMLEDFGQYVRVLADLARLPGRPHAFLIGEQLIDVAVRVDDVKPDALQAALGLIGDYSLFGQVPDAACRPHYFHAVTSAAWIVGELAAIINDTKKLLVVETLMRPEVASFLPAASQAVYLTAVMKVIGSLPASSSSASAETDTNSDAVVGGAQTSTAAAVYECVLKNTRFFDTSGNVDVRDRAAELVAVVQMGDAVRTDIGSVFEANLNPVSAKAQSRVLVPEGLLFFGGASGSGGMSGAIAEDDAQSAADSEDVSDGGAVGGGSPAGAMLDEDEDDEDDEDDEGKSTSNAAKLLTKKSKKDLAKAQEQARERLSQHRQRHGMFYLGGDAEGEAESHGGDVPAAGAEGVASGSGGGNGGGVASPHESAAVVSPALGGSIEAGGAISPLMDLDGTGGSGRTSPVFAGLTSGFAKRPASTSSPRGVVKGDETLPTPQRPLISGGANPDDPLNVDLTSPLSADETLPSLGQYPKARVDDNAQYGRVWVVGGDSQDPASSDTTAASVDAPRERRRSSRSRSHHHGEGGEGEDDGKRHHRRRRKSKSERADAEAGGEEDGEKPRRKHKHKKKRDKDKDKDGADEGAVESAISQPEL